MAAPSKKFSFNRMISNLVPNFARDDPNDVNLSPSQADTLCSTQFLQPHPRYLSETSFFEAGIVATESLSKKVYKALVKNKIMLPVPEGTAGCDETMTVSTGGITKNFANQVAVISVHAQRKLVGLLFFWEEELTRLRLLDQEESEILQALDSESGNRDLTVALEAVEMKKKLLPSQRGEATANVAKGRGHELPSYA